MRFEFRAPGAWLSVNRGLRAKTRGCCGHRVAPGTQGRVPKPRRYADREGRGLGTDRLGGVGEGAGPGRRGLGGWARGRGPLSRRGREPRSPGAPGPPQPGFPGGGAGAGRGRGLAGRGGAPADVRDPPREAGPPLCPWARRAAASVRAAPGMS